MSSGISILPGQLTQIPDDHCACPAQRARTRIKYDEISAMNKNRFMTCPLQRRWRQLTPLPGKCMLGCTYRHVQYPQIAPSSGVNIFCSTGH